MIGRTTSAGHVFGNGDETMPAAAMRYGAWHVSFPEHAEPLEMPAVKMRCVSMHMAVPRSASRSSTKVTSFWPPNSHPLGEPVPSGVTTTYPLAVATVGKRE